MLVILSVIPPLAIVFAVNRYCGTKRSDLKKFAILFLPVGFLIAEVAMQAGYYLAKGLEAVLGSGVIFVMIDNFIIVALLEEGLKYLPLRWRFSKGDPFTNPLYAIAISVTVSMGFAFWEQLYYTLGGTLTSIILRAFLAVPGHMAHSIFMGWFLYLAAKAASSGDETGKKKNFRLALLVPTLTHGTYDVIVAMYRLSQSMVFFWLVFIFALPLIICSIRLLRRVYRGTDPLSGVPVSASSINNVQADCPPVQDDDKNNSTDNDVPEVFYE